MTVKVLFLCTGNSCRSQMAHGFLESFHGNEFDVYSAGIETHGLNPYALKVMNEINISIDHHKSELYSDFSHIQFDYVITVCAHAHETCPLVLNTTVIHIPFRDPPFLTKDINNEADKLKIYREVRDEIMTVCKNFKKEIKNA